MKIIKFPLKSSGRFDLKPVRKLKSKKLEDQGQLNIFDSKNEAPVIELTRDFDFFEAALTHHDSDTEKAIEFYKKAIINKDHVADAFCNLGILLSQANDTAGAIDSFTKSLKKDPRHYEAQFNLANIYADAGDQNLAKLHYEVARKIDAKDPNLHFNLAVVLASLEHYKHAIDSLRKYFEQSGGVSDPDAEKLMILLETSIKKESS